MGKEEFEKLSDQGKLEFYDSQIEEVSEELNKAYIAPVIFMGDLQREMRDERIKVLERKLDSLKDKRQSFLDFLKLGFSKTKKVSRQVFIAAWFDSSMTESIEAISEGITEAGFDPRCIKDEHFSERIMDKALGEIRMSKCVIVDLTGQRPSVFFEAGFAFGLETQIVYVYKKSAEKEISALEFYVKHFKCYGYENPTDLKGLIKEVLLARLSQ